MALAGIEQTQEAAGSQNIFTQVKNLLELQGEMIVQLIESAQVPGPTDRTTSIELGARIDIHV